MSRVKTRRAANQQGTHGGAVADGPVVNEPGRVETNLSVYRVCMYCI